MKPIGDRDDAGVPVLSGVSERWASVQVHGTSLLRLESLARANCLTFLGLGRRAMVSGFGVSDTVQSSAV